MLKIGVVGCLHGRLDKLYGILEKDIDMVIICGDFQGVEEDEDRKYMKISKKRELAEEFRGYREGKKIAPVMTIFVGGNHEVSTKLWERYYGGWVAPNVYFMGISGVILVNGLKIIGISGIYKWMDASRGYLESTRLPGPQKTSIYHTRQYEVDKLVNLVGGGMSPWEKKQLRVRQRSESGKVQEGRIEDCQRRTQGEEGPDGREKALSNAEKKTSSIESSGAEKETGINKESKKDPKPTPKKYCTVVVSHDWPKDVWQYGDTDSLLRRKPTFKKDIEEQGYIGSPLHQILLDKLTPLYWLAGHHHVDYECIHGETKFIGAGNCDNEDFRLRIIEVETGVSKEDPEYNQIKYDTRWLAILKCYGSELPRPGMGTLATYKKIKEYDIRSNELMIKEKLRANPIHQKMRKNKLSGLEQQQILCQFLEIPVVRLIEPDSTLRWVDIAINLRSPQYSAPEIITDIMDRALNAGVEMIMVTVAEYEDLEAAKELKRWYKKVSCTMGVHPTNTMVLERFQNMEESQAYLEEMVGRCEEEIVVAVGEIGLDYARLTYASKEVQQRWFRAQLEMYKETDLPMFLHCREAHKDFLNIMKTYKQHYRERVVHSFTGTIEEARELLAEGYYIGVNGASVRTEEQIQVIREIPLERMLLETDSPWCLPRKGHAGYKYLSPESQEIVVKAKKYNEPAMVRYIGEIVSNATGIPIAAVAAQTTGTALRIFQKHPGNNGIY